MCDCECEKLREEVQTLREVVGEVVDDYEDLRDEFAEERSRRRRTERALAKYQRSHERRHDGLSRWKESTNEAIGDLQERAVDVDDVVTATPDDALIPIQQLYNTVQAGFGDSIDNPNERRAAQVWPHFRKYADPSGGRLTLTSGKVKDLLKKELQLVDPNPNTVRRVMRFVAINADRPSDLPENAALDDENRFIRFKTRSENDVPTNRLECDVEDWKAVTSEMMDVARSGLDDAESRPVATDGGTPRTDREDDSGGITPS